jgi:hypothetical protein
MWYGSHMLELTITSPYLIVDSIVHLSTPMTTNAKFPVLFHSETTNTVGKGRVREKGREGMGPDYTVCLRIYHLWSMGWATPFLT